MKTVKTIDATGMILCHDITKIVPGEFKGVAFKKGHIITESDIPELLKLGKDNLFVWEHQEGTLHENDAAIRIKDHIAGTGLDFSTIKEGKIDFSAQTDGLLKVNVKELLKINMLGEIIVATLQNNTPVKKGTKVAGTRVIPLVIDETKINLMETSSQKKIISILPIVPKKVAIISTGNEVYYGRIQDKFGPILTEKVKEYGCEVIYHTFSSDDKEMIKDKIKEALLTEAEIILCTGGMSVDPDDRTPLAIKEMGGELITYGAPVLPGAMLLLAYHDDKTILGLPGCVMHSKRTAFDLVLPRILAGDRITFKDIASYGHGGLCLNCPICTFPHCSFGK
ncbi:molybdopterin-binding protein [uncultured Cetobacterium sp.]|uniref:molybdopterin-binding protein n=1 Tax=uncultured Cetobacterium sp. TaxID=527638 RepID=UPI00261BEFA5|nr:molybdopterin-binding protein [uncultured Cetobacterium sp.]